MHKLTFQTRAIKKIFSVFLTVVMLSLSMVLTYSIETEEPASETVTEGYDATSEEYNLSVPVVEQEETYYCGPACVYMIDHFLNPSSSKDQNTIATGLGTTPSSGTSSISIYTYLTNHVISSGNYTRCLYSYAYRSEKMRSSIQNGYPVIVGVHIMPYRTYGTPNSGHFIVVRGYDYYPNVSYMVKINDPFDGSYRTNCSFAQLDYGCTSLTGYYVYHQ